MKSHNIKIKAKTESAQEGSRKVRSVLKTQPETKKTFKKEMAVAPTKEDIREQSVAPAVSKKRLQEAVEKRKEEDWKVNSRTLSTPYGKVKLNK